MIIWQVVLVCLCFLSYTSARPASPLIRASNKRKGSLLRSGPIKFKRQTDDLHRRLIGVDPSHYGDQFSAEEHSDESMIHLRKKASIAEVFRHRLMACGLITTKSPERWRDRLIAELDEIVTEIEHRCALCKTLYDEPYRYDVLRSLVDPCPACCRRKHNKKRLLLTLQKVLEKSLDSEHLHESGESSSAVEDENEGHDSNIWPITEVPKSKKTKSTTESSMPLTTQSFVSSREERTSLHSAGRPYQLKPSSWWSHLTTKKSNADTTEDSSSSVNETHVPDRIEPSEPIPIVNGQPVNNVHEFLKQYMNLVYGGQPGNEQRKQFFLEQLCRNATNGRIVLQCNDVVEKRNARSSAETVSAWTAGQNTNPSSNVQKSLLFTTPSVNVLKPKVIGCQSCWTLGRKRPPLDEP